MKNLVCVSLTLIGTSVTSAHEGHSHAPSPETQKEIERLNTDPSVRLVVMQRDTPNQNTARPAMAGYFDPFREKLKVRFDNQYLYVESNGMPDHSMMIGITAWQQQVPLPQPYTGDNAWRIPLNPVPASRPMSAKTNFFRGAIALAVNGVPIFNPIKNDGRTDTLVAGELDQWGGHCGRSDDYHYHIAPVHLEKIVGKGKPLAVALDGYPIYGYADADGSTPTDLDWLNGHKDADGDYHYHATKHYPYINGGFYGEVVERGGQVDPQPRAQGVRPAMPPLRGARITGFSHPKKNLYNVAYDVYGEKRAVSYTIAENGSVEFRFISEDGTKTETYTPRQRGGGGSQRGAGPPPNRRPGPPSDRFGGPPPRGEGPPPNRGGGDPIARALDLNRDGKIDRAELVKASETIRSLDHNGDGNLTSDELRGPGGGRGPEGPPNDRRPDDRPPGDPRDARGSQPGEGPRQPWILVHADEVDINGDKVISREEIVGEATQAFAGYDANQDGKLSESEYGGRGAGSRSAMGGFIRGHARELDRDGDGILTRAEVVGNAERMFAKMDADGDDKITPNELEDSRRR